MTNQQAKETLLKQLMQAELKVAMELGKGIHKHLIEEAKSIDRGLTQSEHHIIQSTAEYVDEYVLRLAGVMSREALKFDGNGRVH